jgi:hypothetical protein
LGSNIRVGVLTALLHYTRRLQSGWRPVAPPRFYPDRPVGDAGTAFELQVGPETRAALERQAEVHHVPLNQVLTHAVFVYLADLDSSPGLNGSSPPYLH